MDTPAAPPAPFPSIRAELLVSFAVLAVAAILVAVAWVALFVELVDAPAGPLYLGVLIAADVSIFVAFGAYLLRRAIIRPLEGAVAAAEAIAAGDLARRLPAGATSEFAALSVSVNRMTDRLLEEQTQRIRLEKLASVGRLAAGVAHEIGNPLGAITGYAHLLRRAAGENAAALEALDGLERESARIDRIVRGLLDYARPRRLTPARVDLNDVIRRTVAFLEDQGLFKRITLELELDPGAPTVFGERHEFEQVFVNLLLNAVDALEREGRVAVHTRCFPRGVLEGAIVRRAGDPPMRIVPRHPAARVQHWLDAARPPGDIVKVVVADSGPGVPDEAAERIFDPFYTTKPPGKGTGLGLAIVARIVENSQGTVWVQPAREGGAAFHLLFPVAVGASLAAVRPPEGVGIAPGAPTARARP